MWNLRNVYLYLVCLISIILIIIGLITFANSMVDMFITTSYYPSAIEKMGTYNKDLNMTKEEYQALVEKETAQNQANEKKNRAKNSIKSLSMFIVALPFYIYHWRKIQKEQPAK